MATAASTSGSSAQTSSKTASWASVKPLRVGSEDAMGDHAVAQTWAKMYNLAGLDRPGEDEQRSFRLAVYAYACQNGTSREGDYNADITMNNGHTFNASVIPQATGKLNIRKFFRGNMNESYQALKESGIMEENERFVAKAADLSISAESAFAIADWMAGCPKFTPSESNAHRASFAVSLQRAKRARDGQTLERVESDRVKEELEAQGPLVAEREIKF